MSEALHFHIGDIVRNRITHKTGMVTGHFYPLHGVKYHCDWNDGSTEFCYYYMIEKCDRIERPEHLEYD